jgi:hypothetical protein
MDMADVAKVVNGGLGLITGWILGAGATEPHHIGWGIGTTEAAVGDTGLESASAESRTTGTGSQQTTTTTNDTYRVVGSITCTGAGKAITEVALYTDATAGTCFMRGTFSAINVSVGDSIEFTINNVLDQA